MESSTAQRVILEKLKFYAQRHLPANLVRQSKLDIHLGHASDNFVMTMATYIAGKQKKEVDVTYPADWWEAVKDRWVPKFLRRRLRIKYRHIKVDSFTVFPSIAVPDHTSNVIIDVMDRTYLSGGGDE